MNVYSETENIVENFDDQDENIFLLDEFRGRRVRIV